MFKEVFYGINVITFYNEKSESKKRNELQKEIEKRAGSCGDPPLHIYIIIINIQSLSKNSMTLIKSERLLDFYLIFLN